MLQTRAEFLAVRKGLRARGQFVRLEAIRHDAVSDAADPRIGFTVSKKNGNAVRRNRIKRRLREAVRQSAAREMRRDHDYVLIATPGALTAPFDVLCADVRSVIEAANDKLARSDEKSRTH